MADQAGDTIGTYSTEHYRRHYLRLLRIHLAQARRGELRIDWRDNIAPAGAASDPHCRFNDAEIVAVSALLDYPPAPWEPHRAANWKHALTSWVTTQRWALLLEFELAHQNWPFDDEDSDGGPATTPENGVWVAALYKVACDRTTASYFAGLCGGGEWPRHRWLDWYRHRIDHWDHRGWAQAETDRLETHGELDQMEALPLYWQQQAGDEHR